MARTILAALAGAPLALAGAPLALIGCDAADATLTTDPPTTVTLVADHGFHAPTDAVASPDGARFYFAARTDAGEPAIFATSSAPGSTPEVLAQGAPLVDPSGLVMSCDGRTLYIADQGSEAGGVLALAAEGGGGGPRSLGASAIVHPVGLAMRPDCATIVATGRTAAGEPALFALPAAGGDGTVVYKAGPLVSPSGVHVDLAGVAWVMDREASAAQGAGVLFAIPEDGSSATPVLGGLAMGTPGGVSLVAGGGTAVMATRDAAGKPQLTSVRIATGEITQLPVPAMTSPAGLRTARGASVIAVADRDGDAILRAE